MAVITIRGQLGSGAPEIGKILAGNLNFDFVDREIIEQVASLTRYSARGIAQKEMPAGTLSGRIVEALNSTYPAGITREGAYLAGYEIPLEDWKYLESLQAVIKELAVKGSIVIRGRGSQFILKNRADTLHVLIVAPLQLRIKRVMENLKIEEQAAKKEIIRFDSSRREFIKRYFKAEIEDPVNYDQVINTNGLNYQDSASLIAFALSLKQKFQTAQM
jgi:CMP/dCMP kinase